MKFFIKGFFSMWPNIQFSADSVTFLKKSLMENFIFLAVISNTYLNIIFHINKYKVTLEPKFLYQKYQEKQSTFFE